MNDGKTRINRIKHSNMQSYVIEHILSDLVDKGLKDKLHVINPEKYDNLVKAYQYVKKSNSTKE